MTRIPSRTLSLAHLTAIDLPPPQLIEAAARAGFDGVGLRLLQVTPATPGYPLMDDPALMHATQRAMAATGVRVMDIEFVRLTPDTRPADLCPLLDAGAALGARHLITAPYDPDLSRLADTLGDVANLASERGIGTVLEFFPWTLVPDLAAAKAVVERAGPDVGILVDALHFNRSGSSLEALRATPPHRLPFAHLCDARVQPPYSEAQLLHTAREDRLAPGLGKIDLHAFIAALPADVPLSAEVPVSNAAGLASIDARLADLHDRCRALMRDTAREGHQA